MISNFLRRAATKPLPAIASLRAAPAVSPLNSFMLGGVRTLLVRVADTPNPDSLKFLPVDDNQQPLTVLPEAFGSGMHFQSLKDAKGSKLVHRLLSMDNVTSVFLGRDFVSVNKDEEEDWNTLRPIVLGVIIDELSSEEPLVQEVEQAQDTAVTEDDDEITATIKELLDTRIRPAVQEDGGDIFFEGYDPETGVVSLRMAGSCVGCPSSTVTLRNGVENMLMYYVPEVTGIRQVEDEDLKQVNEDEFRTLEDKLKAAGVPTE